MKIHKCGGKKYIRLKDAAKVKQDQGMSQARFLQMKEEKEWAWDQFQKIKDRCKKADAAKQDAEAKLKHVTEAHANEALAAMLVKARLDQFLAWAALNAPQLLRLETHVKAQKAQAAAGLSRPIHLHLKQRKRGVPRAARG